MKYRSKQDRVDGYIAHLDLANWWFSTFTKDERGYIDKRYQPLGLPPLTLTQGKWSTSKPASQFLNEVATWFRSSQDAPIAERIHSKVDELGRTNPFTKPGYHNGRHFTTYVADVENLRKQDRLQEVESLLLELVAATEAEGQVEGLGVAPWYYEALAKVYRKQRAYSAEVKILERFAGQQHAPGVMPPKLMERLEKAKRLVNAKTG